MIKERKAGELESSDGYLDIDYINDIADKVKEELGNRFGEALYTDGIIDNLLEAIDVYIGRSLRHPRRQRGNDWR